jgi:hypothetical protein
MNASLILQVVAEAPESTTKHFAKTADAVARDRSFCGVERPIEIMRPR